MRDSGDAPQAEQTPAMRLTGLTKRFGRRTALDNVSLTLRRGEVYALVGANGAGKTTLMRMACGLTVPSSGSVEMFGEEVPPGAASPRLGCLVDGPGLYPGLTGLGNAVVRACALGLTDPRASATQVMAAVGLEKVAGRRARAYSLGQRQRLGLALALLGTPDLLVLDEPFNGLDPQGAHDMRVLLGDLARQRGVAVMVSSHALDQLGRLATRYGVLRAGRLVREMTETEVAAACAGACCVRSPTPQLALVALQEGVCAAGAYLESDGTIVLPGTDLEGAGSALARAGVTVSGLWRRGVDREGLFLPLMMGEAATEPAPSAAPVPAASPVLTPSHGSTPEGA